MKSTQIYEKYQEIEFYAKIELNFYVDENLMKFLFSVKFSICATTKIDHRTTGRSSYFS